MTTTKTDYHYDFLLLNVPLLRPAWPVPTFTRTLPMLVAEGFRGDWWDENIKFFRFYYSEERLLMAHQILQQRLSLVTHNHIEKQLRKVLEKPIDFVITSLRQISDKDVFTDLRKYNQIFYSVFHDAAQILSYAYDVTFDYNQLIYRSPLDGSGYNFHKCNDVIELVNGSPKNISYPFFQQNTVPRILEVMPRVIGISIGSAFELVPAFTLAKLIKDEIGDSSHIVFGGNFLSRIEHRFRNSEPEKDRYKQFWNWMDSYIFSKGDVALVDLVKNILSKTSLDLVPNLVYKTRDTIRETPFHYGPGINELPQTDYGSILDSKNLYFVPPELLTVPIYTSIGCSYAKCTFCSIDKMSGNFHGDLKVKIKNGTKILSGNDGTEFRFFRTADKIVQEVINLKEKYSVNFFSFNDETADIDFLLDFCNEVIKHNVKIFWQAFARVEDKLAKAEICRKLYDGGCRLLRIGFEYLSQEKLNLSHKGYSLKRQYDVVKNLNDAGIWIHAYFMLSGESDFNQIKHFFEARPEYLTLLHSLEFFSFVKDRHSLDIIQGLKSGVYNPDEINKQFPEFRIWYDENIQARGLVRDIEQFSRQNFPMYGLVCAPCEVAYFAPLNHINGVRNLIDKCQNDIHVEGDKYE